MPAESKKRKLCVAQVLPALDEGGVERGTLEVAAALAERGHRALVISGGGRLVNELEAAGATHIRLPVGVKSPWTLRLIPRLRRLFRKEAVDIVHARSRLPAWIAHLALRSMPKDVRPRFVTTVHGLYSVNAYSAIMTRGEVVIAVSESVRSYIRESYPKASGERIRVIHRGVDRARFAFGYQPSDDWLARWRTELPQLEGRFVVTLPARLTRLKGQIDFVEVVARLVEKNLPVHGLLVGGHDARRRAYVEEVKNEICAAGLDQNITLLGHRSDLREIMAISDVVVSLSRDPEAFGRTTIEALSLGRPVCGYDHGGVGEQLRAVLPEGAVPVRNAEAVAQRIESWRRQPPGIPADHPFTLPRMLNDTLEVYKGLTSRLVASHR